MCLDANLEATTQFMWFFDNVFSYANELPVEASFELIYGSFMSRITIWACFTTYYKYYYITLK